MNSHQQQLLQLLQIKPLQLHADFQQFQHVHTPVNVARPTITSEETFESTESVGTEPANIMLSSQIPAEFESFAADIQRALQLYLPNMPWRWSAKLQQSELNNAEIHTPDLIQLTNTAQKKQLWQVISLQSDNSKLPEHSPQPDHDENN